MTKLPIVKLPILSPAKMDTTPWRDAFSHDIEVHVGAAPRGFRFFTDYSRVIMRLFIGKTIRIRYNELTVNKKPRNPVYISVHDPRDILGT